MKLNWASVVRRALLSIPLAIAIISWHYFSDPVALLILAVEAIPTPVLLCRRRIGCIVLEI